ncbi:EutN/CcmL family microcompartment protein [Carbonactinospora thermoautotrophica]|uniref:EutN/CcmL family microcompartment protein n=1 Tax=Carbonactinospora thermoautotrophica TaxID=1469144 RepID=UPI003DA99D93
MSTIKQDGLHGLKLLLVEPVDPLSGEGGPSSRQFVAVDLAGAGQGEVVVVTRGSGARIPPHAGHVPTDAAVVAIVDSVVVDNETTFRKSE